jgi:hypothetical protein
MQIDETLVRVGLGPAEVAGHLATFTEDTAKKTPNHRATH